MAGNRTQQAHDGNGKTNGGHARPGRVVSRLMVDEPETEKEGAGADGPVSRKQYDKVMKKLQGELVKVQLWAKHTGAKIVVLFEGRDAAGKGGVIKAITERTSPRVFRITALPAPTERQKSQMYLQRYVELLPAAGEIILFDRSWYNRAGVESVMGFCKPAQVKRFLTLCPSL